MIGWLIAAGSPIYVAGFLIVGRLGARIVLINWTPSTYGVDHPTHGEAFWAGLGLGAVWPVTLIVVGLWTLWLGDFTAAKNRAKREAERKERIHKKELGSLREHNRALSESDYYRYTYRD